MKATADDIEKYRKGKLSPAERHALEKEALSDPFLADALEGSELITPEQFAEDVAKLSGRIDRRKPIFTPLRIAAGVIVVVAAAWFTLYTIDETEPAKLTSADEKPQASVSKDSAAAAGEENKNDLLSLQKEEEKKDEAKKEE